MIAISVMQFVQVRNTRCSVSVAPVSKKIFEVFDFVVVGDKSEKRENSAISEEKAEKMDGSEVQDIPRWRTCSDVSHLLYLTREGHEDEKVVEERSSMKM